jgi:hypothetical protein
MTASNDRHEAVKDYLEDETGKQVGLIRSPTDKPTKPYAILKPFGGTTPNGDMSSRMANRDVRYTVQCVGVDEWQVCWMRDAVLTAMVDGNPFVDAQWVLLESEGAIVPDGEGLYSSTDNYLMRL